MASQQPPTDERSDLRRVELVVEKWDSSDYMLKRLFIFEAKKHNASQAEIEEVEYQAFEACMKHTEYANRQEMYAMTVIGTRARL